MGYFRTAILLAAMTALFMGIGYLIGGQTGMVIAFLVAAAMNLFAYWNSDRVVLSMYGAREVDERAHELGHVKHRDTLTMTITATLAGAISMLANFGFYFGGNRNNDGVGPIGGLLLVILAPIAAALVQFGISRGREYEADRIGAEISKRPLSLASALRKISSAAEQIPNPPAERNPASAHLFIVNPLSGARMDNLFSTHPNVENRIERLDEIAARMGQGTAVETHEPPVRASGPWASPQQGGWRRRGPWDQT